MSLAKTSPSAPRKFVQADKQDRTSYLTTLRTGGNIGTNVAGLLNTTILLDPSSAQDWTRISNFFDEFRVHGIKVSLTSTAPNSVTRTTSTCFAVFDNDDSTAITSVATAYNYSTKVVFPAIFTHTVDGTGRSPLMDIQFSRPVTKSSPIEWRDVGTPSGSLGAIKFASEALDASTTYFHAYIEWYVEARGRR